MQSFLIIGGTVNEREEKAKEFIDRSLSKFDVLTLQGETIGIGEVRQLSRSLSLKPMASEQKLAIIHEAQTLTIEAQNALLKTLEEPSSHTTIVLTAPHIDLLLSTIGSRCQVIQLKTNNKQLTTDEQSLVINHLSLIISGGVGERLKIAQDVGKTREEAISWLKNLILVVRQALIDQLVSNQGNISISQYLSVLVSLQKTHTILKTTNANIRLALETLLLTF